MPVIFADIRDFLGYRIGQNGRIESAWQKRAPGLPLLASTVAAAHELDRTLKLREWFSKAVVAPLLEKAFPEMYWEPMFLCSPRGRMMIRRKKPVAFKVEWK